MSSGIHGCNPSGLLYILFSLVPLFSWCASLLLGGLELFFWKEGNITGAGILELPGGNSEVSGAEIPWHMWKIHLPWLKRLTSQPSDAVIKPTPEGQGSQGKRGVKGYVLVIQGHREPVSKAKVSQWFFSLPPRRSHEWASAAPASNRHHHHFDYPNPSVQHISSCCPRNIIWYLIIWNIL